MRPTKCLLLLPPSQDFVALLGLWCLATALVLGGCNRRDDPKVTLLGLRPNTVVVEIEAPPGTELGQTVDEVAPTIGDSGRMTHTYDIADYSCDEMDTLGVRTRKKGLIGETWGQYDLKLPHPIGLIKQLPTEKQGFVVYRLLDSDKQPWPLKTDPQGRVEVTVAVVGDVEIEMAGEPIELDEWGVGSTAVTLTDGILGAGLVGAGTAKFAVKLTRDGKAETRYWEPPLLQEEVSAALDKWLAAGAPAPSTGPVSEDGILWRRRTKTSRSASFEAIANETPGFRWLADEVPMEERIRGCGYSALKGVTREVIIRELRTGREVARRTFPYPSGARCGSISFRGEPDRFVYAEHKTIRRWLLDQVRSPAGSRARAQAASANRGHQEGKRAAAHQPDRASARPPAPGRSDKARDLGSQLSKAL